MIWQQAVPESLILETLPHSLVALNTLQIGVFSDAYHRHPQILSDSEAGQCYLVGIFIRYGNSLMSNTESGSPAPSTTLGSAQAGCTSHVCLLTRSSILQLPLMIKPVFLTLFLDSRLQMPQHDFLSRVGRRLGWQMASGDARIPQMPDAVLWLQRMQADWPEQIFKSYFYNCTTQPLGNFWRTRSFIYSFDR